MDTTMNINLIKLMAKFFGASDSTYKAIYDRLCEMTNELNSRLENNETLLDNLYAARCLAPVMELYIDVERIGVYITSDVHNWESEITNILNEGASRGLFTGSCIPASEIREAGITISDGLASATMNPELK